MDKKELLKRANDPDHIAGIYNYCDRWCERCAFTSRCLNYEMEDERNQEREGAESDNERFWRHIQDSFETAMQLLEDFAAEQGVDLDALEFDEDAPAENKEHILSHMADRYARSADGWLALNREPIEDVLEKENSHLKVVRPVKEKDRIPLEEAIAVVGYYRFFISAKLSRALRGKDEEAAIDFSDMPKDSDGSAKIALIAMDRSISAWGALASALPDQKSSLLDFMSRLKRMRDIAEKEFPDARAFVRPGLDE